MEGQQSMVLWIMFAAGMMFSVLLIMAWIFIKRTAYLSPVKRELKKEKQWLRRGEYNAAMVKGRQNLELLFKVVAANNGIRLDNTAAAQANARSVQERNRKCRSKTEDDDNHQSEADPSFQVRQFPGIFEGFKHPRSPRPFRLPFQSFLWQKRRML